MSHTTKLKSVVITSVTALQAAVVDLKKRGVNCELRQNEVPRMYYQNQHGKCDYVLRLNDGAYDVGFEKQADGTYVPVFDEWSDHISNQLGAGAACPMPNTAEGRAQHQIGQFFQEYGKNAAMEAAAAQGYMVESASYDAKGNIQLVMTGM